MPKIDELVVNYAIYENATEYLGTTEVELPDIAFLTEEISGAGIGGKVEEIIMGHIEAMSTTFSFRTVTAAAALMAILMGVPSDGRRIVREKRLP